MHRAMEKKITSDEYRNEILWDMANFSQKMRMWISSFDRASEA
jgi:hypothetical protein